MTDPVPAPEARLWSRLLFGSGSAGLGCVAEEPFGEAPRQAVAGVRPTALSLLSSELRAESLAGTRPPEIQCFVAVALAQAYRRAEVREITEPRS